LYCSTTISNCSAAAAICCSTASPVGVARPGVGVRANATVIPAAMAAARHGNAVVGTPVQRSMPDTGDAPPAESGHRLRCIDISGRIAVGHRECAGN
jgi:hypothetical protein